MNVLSVDIGNTSIHYGLMQSGRKITGGDIKTDHYTSYTDLLEYARSADGIAWCSVVPDAAEVFIDKIRSAKLEAGTLHLTHENCPGLAIDYPNPEEIGQDRLANAIGAQKLCGAPAIVIDMGTAVTFDVLTSKGYSGGVIAPGLAIMTEYLNEQTALLPKLDPGELMVSSGIGRTTVDAMKLGCAVGFQGMIRALLDRVRAELEQRGESDPKIIATGGSAGALPKTWEPEIAWEPDITLLGLEEAFHRQYQGIN